MSKRCPCNYFKDKMNIKWCHILVTIKIHYKNVFLKSPHVPFLVHPIVLYPLQNLRLHIRYCVCIHKFRHYCFGNKFVFYMDYMALVYLINNPQVLGKFARQLLLFLQYEFKVVYKLGQTHAVVNALFKLLDSIKPMGIPYRTIDAMLF